MQIFELSDRQDLLDPAVDFFWNCWGNRQNHAFYRDCIDHSLNPDNKLPKFYLAVEENRIIATYALLTNDVNSRQDLVPWLGCLFVADSHRHQGVAGTLLQHGLQQAKLKGFQALYLSTDLLDFYESKGWQHFGEAYNLTGEKLKVYWHPV
jgi:predicted N-acetyltransferase YhbS